jgi:P-type Cu2+ transporter
LVRLGVAGAIAGNVMLLSFALYSGAFQGMAPEFRRLFEVASMIISVPSLSYCAMEFYRGALSSIRTRTPHMDLPVSLGILAGALWGGASVIRGQGEVWFDTVTALVFLLLVGRFVELRQQNRARQAVERAQMLTPARAHVIDEEGNVRDVLVEEVQPGDKVLVKSGETIPVDGVVAMGRSELDNRVLTGESRPVAVSPGVDVFAGATNLTGVLRVQSTSRGTETRVARLMREVERARLRRPKVVRLADRVAGIFVVVVLLLALVTLALWWPYDSEAALQHTIALLVVACPCALGMATPLTVSAALARAAEQLVLVKGGDVLEVVRKPCLIVFDKTGTLTTGSLRLRSWKGERHVKALVRALEETSSHPIAQAFCRALPAPRGVTVDEVREEPGGGIQGRVTGRSIAVGAPAWLVRLGTMEPDWVRAEVRRQSELGYTPVAIAADGLVVAVACFDDPVTSDAAQSLSRLKRLGYQCAVLSGDHQAVTRSVAQALARAVGEPRLFSDVVGGATPEDKLAYVTARKVDGPVVVVGDGVNDAAALAAASVGVAAKGGAEASLLAADVYLGKAGLAQLVLLIEGARCTFATVQRGIAMSLGYNVVMVGLAMAGWVGPLLAAILMPLSSLSVVTNAYRSKTFERFG